MPIRDRSDYLTDRNSERKEAEPQVASALAIAAMGHEQSAKVDDTDDGEVE